MEACGKALNVLPKAMKMNEDAQSCCVACESIACFAPCECCVLVYSLYEFGLNIRGHYEPDYSWLETEKNKSDGSEELGRKDDSENERYV